jgi:hypothetical protein
MATRDLSTTFLRLRSALHRKPGRPDNAAESGGTGLLNQGPNQTADMVAIPGTSIYHEQANEIRNDMKTIHTKSERLLDLNRSQFVLTLDACLLLQSSNFRRLMSHDCVLDLIVRLSWIRSKKLRSLRRYGVLLFRCGRFDHTALSHMQELTTMFVRCGNKLKHIKESAGHADDKQEAMLRNNMARGLATALQEESQNFK